MPRLVRHRKHALWITLMALGVAAFAALRAPAVGPPGLDRALASQRTLAAERPNDPQVANDLGNLLVLAGETGAAEKAYRRALELAPDMTSARYNLGLLLLQTERPKEALKSFRAVVDAEPEHAWAHYQIGAVLDQKGDESEAVREYSKAFRLDPQLAFPEINPHVIQNRHVTEAMLRAYRNLPVVSQVPKAYEEPSRIVNLMVPEPAVGAPGVEEPAQAAETRKRGKADGMRPTPAYTPGAPGEEPATARPGGEKERILREEDLQRGGAVNQVVVPGGVYQPPRGGTRVPPVRTFPPGGSTSPDGRNPGTQPPTGRQRFVPGIPSTGRLEIELFPTESDEEGELATAG